MYSKWRNRQKSHIVGYQNLTVTGEDAGGVSWLLNTLPAVGKDLDKCTLGDFKVVSPEGGLVSPGSVLVYTYDDYGQDDGAFVYLDDVTGSDYGVDAGWYTAESVDNWDPVSCADEVIRFGRGFCVFSDCGATLTCAGQVCAEDVSVSIIDEDAGGVTWTGNCSPVDLKLSEVAIVSPEGGLVSPGSVLVYTYDDYGQDDGAFVYLDDVTASDYGVDAGWYTAESVDDWDPVSCGNEVISAGRMFCVFSDCGATLVIPSALK